MPDGRSLLDQSAPRALTREGRVRMLAALADALLDGRRPGREVELFVGAALRAWLDGGGPLERHLRVGAPRGSHLTVQRLARGLIADERK